MYLQHFMTSTVCQNVTIPLIRFSLFLGFTSLLKCSTNLLTSAVIFVFHPAPSCLPIVPHSSYFFKNLWTPCLVAGRFSSASSFAIFGALCPSSQRLTIHCHLYSLYEAITLAIDQLSTSKATDVTHSLHSNIGAK